MKDRGDKSERNKLNKERGWVGWEQRRREAEEDEGEERHRRKDRWRGETEIGLPADKIAVCDRFLPRLNWARGLRGISLSPE